MMISKIRDQKGFTIIEMMISTAILSTILLIVTVLMINVGNLYYKGINQARIQGDVRDITEEVSQHLQLSEGYSQAPANAGFPNINAYCMGDQRYTYITGVQIGHQGGMPAAGPVYYHVLWRDPNPTLGSCAIDATNGTAMTNANATGGTELVSPNSRLTAFSITGSAPSPYTLAVGVAYGDTDLMNPNGINTTCKGTKGEQFCATASLTTTVGQRLTGKKD